MLDAALTSHPDGPVATSVINDQPLHLVKAGNGTGQRTQGLPKGFFSLKHGIWMISLRMGATISRPEENVKALMLLLCGSRSSRDWHFKPD